MGHSLRSEKVTFAGGLQNAAEKLEQEQQEINQDFKDPPDRGVTVRDRRGVQGHAHKPANLPALHCGNNNPALRCHYRPPWHIFFRSAVS